MGGGVAWLMKQKAKCHVLPNSSSGEANALSHADKDWIGRVVSRIAICSTRPKYDRHLRVCSPKRSSSAGTSSTSSSFLLGGAEPTSYL